MTRQRLRSWLASAPASLAAAVGLAASLAVPAAAVPPFSVPRTDQSPRFDAQRKAVVVAAVGMSDPRLSSNAAARLSARRRAVRRALLMLHVYVDDALATVQARPWQASAIHNAVDQQARVVGIRPLVDQGAVVLMELPAEALRSASVVHGVSWE